MMKILSFIAVLTMAGSAMASVDQKTSAFVLCKNKKDVRTLRILPDIAKRENCSITYSKGNTEEVVGSNRSISQCKSILKNIQANLESSHWSCRSVQSAQITTSGEVTKQ